MSDAGVDKHIVRALRVSPGERAALRDRRPSEPPAGWITKADRTGKDGVRRSRKTIADARLKAATRELAAGEELLYANEAMSVLVIMQGLDAAGKDGTVKHVLSGLNPQGCEVTSFKQPSAEELDHDFLWRISKAVPARGRIGIFNRSHYEDVLVTRVHPDILEASRLPGGVPTGKSGKPKESFWQQRYADINAFEQHLDRNGTRIVKFFLHVSFEEQRARLLARLDDPSKRWKFSASDLAEHERWADYQVAYEDAITATSTEWAPWYVIPADHKHVMRALVGGVLAHTVTGLGLRPPKVATDRLGAIAAAKAALLTEAGSS